MKQKKYKILRDYNRYRKGDVVELNKNTAANMVKRGAAEEVKAEPKKKATKKDN